MTDRVENDNIPESDGAEPDSPLWRFACELYASPGVAEHCLRLQDRQCADVNLLLVCCWAGLRGAYLPAEQIERLDRLVSPWRKDVVKPLRAMRRQLKTAVGPVEPGLSPGVRETIKKAELQAEKVELDLLLTALESVPAKNAREAERGGVIRRNLLHYCALLQANTAEPDVRNAVETLVIEAIAVEPN